MDICFISVSQKYRSTWKVFGIWCWRRMETTSWTDRARNEEVLHSQGGEEYLAYSKEG
jgi:hypothetical protein